MKLLNNVFEKMKKKEYWKNRKVFITGINGFVGSNLAKVLSFNGALVYGLVRNLNPNTFLYFEGVNKRVTLINGELNDLSLLKRIIGEEKIQDIFHLAAQVEVGTAIKNPYLTFETNVRGTYTLLEAARMFQEDIESVIIASSDKAYGTYPLKDLPYKEDYPLKATYPYDVSKACGDMIAQTYSTSIYNLPVVTTRFANIYGPGQLNFSALIPDCIKCALGYDTFKPRTNGAHYRDFLFIDDVIELYLRISESLSNSKNIRGQIFNAGSNNPYNIKDLTIKIFQLILDDPSFTKFKNLLIFPKEDVKGEILYQRMNFEKVYKFFNWKPKVKIEEGIKISTKWYSDYLKSI